MVLGPYSNHIFQPNGVLQSAPRNPYLQRLYGSFPLGAQNVFRLPFLSEKFFYLDASLWACALHHFQTSVSSSPQASSVLVARYKRQLIDAVEAAEHRCFGGKVDNSCVVFLPDHPSPAMRAQRGRPSGHWDWEDMVGAWIRQTPVHKKLKIEDNRLHASSRYNRSRSRSRSPNTTCSLAVSTSIPLSTSRQHSSTSSPSPSYDQLSEAESATDNGSEYQGALSQ